ncbi:MAG TPA: 2,3-diaminopropionate biosynthesis protein SbnB [Pyrinomonadaceae bacterium]|jgi:ornithine cyclodeaminase|nr:2,3-diaminopropionate biosynthesis protein SbnB [Pyrinomonadaceae bacterium]
MRDGDLLILKSQDVASLLEGRERELMQAVRSAYEAHAAGESSLPHSVFLRFPDGGRNRIIALPAYLGQGFNVAGLKWVSSFPNNLERGLDRASAVLILNSSTTGRPEALIEGALISARRTAASAALAAEHLHGRGREVRAGLVGCGLINLEVTRFLRAVYPEARTFVAYDLDRGRAERFGRKCEEEFGGVDVRVADSLDALLRECSLVSLATTAVEPYISDLSACEPGSTILHVSLRDLSPEVILAADNVVDDVDHVCRAQTSVHLAEQVVGNRDFIRCTLADILRGGAEPRTDPERISVFSPFGLGILDLAVGKLVRDLAAEREAGLVIPAFLNDSASVA